ncbi:cotranscriptional regulator FAM172A homolog [Oncorhynchus keta]|uniref:cotranscriptional regulator FAM172A homolog n=1 Tax=Oncorhynchus keta TaxID=8018 RepID=UPI00227AB1E4|nr:cotranscriptional regulator FAM172A homolog [Oncorhynchus keta]XP_052370719.1 cotranscriptional regulator FAM172A homolog [Oncorhynchus keta]XP_052370720.1 cotranscriptional regulator FAM172A homolog [Oncorhynchus keta]XP_052370721.1 cotranscriptional regulator FAM172A homolog [Oncorhynchus keta]XP_052370722.1 cotranscriptional regulator FAM172A homolog [Oncorhynchus keta]XP_052370723.1 cotranscriptional regulator FAM172A homolog [Oncorhynchus keta]XP_052370724.1 cotranscriptional regulato
MELMLDTAKSQGQTQSQGGQTVSPPSIFPYRFTSDGRLCHRVTQEPFMFQRSCDPDAAQREDQALCLHVTQHVHSLLEEQLHLFRLYLPPLSKEVDLPPPSLSKEVYLPPPAEPQGQGDHRVYFSPHRGAPSQGYVYLSPGALESPATLLVVVQDRGTMRCGLWSWRAAASRGLERGSMIPYVKRVLEEGSSVLLMNPNQGGGVGETPEEHVHRVWDLLVSRCVSRRVVVVAHGYGGLAFVDLLCRRPQQVVGQVWAAAFLDSSHSLWHQPLDVVGREWLRTRSRRWVLSSKPLNQPVGSLKAGCPQMSAGTQSHDAAPSVCMESVFRFFSKTLSPKPPTTFSMVTRSRGHSGTDQTSQQERHRQALLTAPVGQIRPHNGRGITRPY